MKKITTLFVLLVSLASFAQNINDYKYVLVPSKYSFNKETNAYGLNTLTKSMLEKYGFVVYMDTDQMPDDVLKFNCNKLYADVTENNTITNIKLTIILRDCKNNVVFRSEGKSREKDWKTGYAEAFRNAAKAFDALGYKYNGTTIDVAREVVVTTNDGSTIKKEIIPIHSQTIGEALFAQPTANGFQLVDTTPKVVMLLFNTGSKDLYMAEKGATKGVLRNDAGQWVFEYYADGKLISEKFNVKF